MAAATGRFYAMNFRDGQEVHREQKLALGQLGLDDRGNVWSYVEFHEDVGIGQWVTDRQVAELGVEAKDISAVSPSALLKLTFDNALATGYVHEGAFGTVTTGAASGLGQGFVIDSIVSSTEVNIQLLHDKTRNFTTRTGWQADLGATNTVTLFYPGGVLEGNVLADNSPDTVRGVAQVAVDVSDVSTDGRSTGGAFGWVQQTGLGVCLVDANGTDIANTQKLYLAAAGLFAGRAADDRPSVGRALALYQPSADNLVLADLNITNNLSRFYGPVKRPLGAHGQVVR